MAEKFNKVKYKNDFIRENYDRLNIFVQKGVKDELRKYASRQNSSMNEVVNSMLMKRLAKSRKLSIRILMEDTDAKEGCCAEHGLSVYVQTPKHDVLLDTGATAKFMQNAEQLGIDLREVDTVVLSHGHYDHSGGITELAKLNKKAIIYMQKSAMDDFYHGERYIGTDKAVGELSQVIKIEGERVIDDELSIFSGIKGRRFMPKSNIGLSKRVDGKDVQDEFEHEQCLVIRTLKGNVLLSGCAHNGILNVLDRYRELYRDEPIMVISGFHMMKKSEYSEDERAIIEETARELAKMNTVFYTGHCTGKAAYEIMKPIMGEKLQPIHSGVAIELKYVEEEK